MSKIEALAQMQEVLDRKNALQRQRQSVSFPDMQAIETSFDQDLIPLRRDQIAPNHLWGMRSTSDGKRE